jgi:hypothetical protein
LDTKGSVSESTVGGAEACLRGVCAYEHSMCVRRHYWRCGTFSSMDDLASATSKQAGTPPQEEGGTAVTVPAAQLTFRDNAWCTHISTASISAASSARQIQGASKAIQRQTHKPRLELGVGFTRLDNQCVFEKHRNVAPCLDFATGFVSTEWGPRMPTGMSRVA